MVLLAGGALASDPIIYPAKGQTHETMSRDKAECNDWAKQQSGYDPANPPVAKAGATSASPGRGALGGAVLGGIIGSTGANLGKGMAVGAVGGALIGGARRSSQESAQIAAQQQQIDQLRSQFNRAYSACLEGRGYTVK
jgi:hypothetical protein